MRAPSARQQCAPPGPEVRVQAVQHPATASSLIADLERRHVRYCCQAPLATVQRSSCRALTAADAPRRFRTLMDAYAAELGGNLTEAEKALVKCRIALPRSAIATLLFEAMRRKYPERARGPATRESPSGRPISRRCGWRHSSNCLTMQGQSFRGCYGKLVNPRCGHQESPTVT